MPWARAHTGGLTMGDKSPHKDSKKKAVKSLKEKRSAKHEKKDPRPHKLGS